MPKVRFVNKVIMFCDLHNFSRIVPLLGNSYPKLIQQYYQLVGNCVVHSGGKLLKYMGDAILSVFPDKSEIDAIRCAMQIRSKYKELLDKLNLDTDSEVEIGIGAGVLSIGVFGHSSLKMPDIFGQAINETAMIMHYRGIALTEEAYRNVQKAIHAEEVTPKEVKWQKEPLRVWKVIDVLIPTDQQ